MKTFVLRTICLVLLAGASWAVWGADGAKKRELPTPALKPTATSQKVAVADDDDRSKLAVPAARQPAVPAPAPETVKTPAAPSKPSLTTDTSVHLSLSTLTPTPEMWFYEQMRQDYNNPTLQMRLRGERAAAERRARIAAREWYGVSLARPAAHVTPFTYYYSPTWGSNTANPYIWSGGRSSTQIIIEARRPTVSVSGFGMW